MRWFISIRYFLSHKRQSLVCILGVVISVTMFISMTALMNGLSDRFIIETVESTGHVTIKDEPREAQTKILERVYTDPNALITMEGAKPRETPKKISNSAGLLRMLDRMPGIVAAAPMVNGNAIATYRPRSPPSAKTSSPATLGGCGRPATASSSVAASPTCWARIWKTASSSPGLTARAPTRRSSASFRPA
jgi:ABC-type lipoprotein release transport system permease subunit